MGELKSEKIYRQNMFGKIFTREVYEKSEADKVIAELKEIDSKNRLAYYKDLSMMAKDVEHQKHKRCLAMAKWCYTMDCMMLETAQKNGTFFKDSWCWKRALWYGKWKRKWLALAEKLKETK